MTWSAARCTRPPARPSSPAARTPAAGSTTEESLRLLVIRDVYELAVDDDRALPVGKCLLVLLHDAPSSLDLVVGRRKDLVQDRDLTRMHARRTAQPERTRTFCDSPERVEVAEIRDRADEAEREAPGRDGGDHDLEARDRASLSACLHPRRDREVARAQPDRDDAGMRAGDLRRVQQAFRPFDPRKEERVAEGQAALLLYCGGHLGEREHVLRGVDLRQDERADILVHRGLDVTDRETPRPVDPHEHVDIALDDLGGRLADEPAGAIFLRRRDGVLELEDHGIGAALVRLRDELFRDDRDVEQRAPARRHTTPSASSFASPPAEIPSSA